MLTLLFNDARERVTTGKKIVKGKGKNAKTTYAPKEDFKAVALEVSTDPGVKEQTSSYQRQFL